jgi:S1-C subfamily serine protease
VLIVMAIVSLPPQGKRAEHVAPTAFGRVYEESRASLVRVMPADVGVSAKAWATGFVIGAKGEVVFNASGPLPRSLTVRTDDGQDHRGELLGFDRELGLAVGRIAGDVSALHLTPLRVAKDPGLIEKRWVVVLKHDPKGRAEPFAGVVSSDPQLSRSKQTRRDLLIAPVGAPASPGSPVLSTAGELVGIALDEGKRSTRVLAAETFVPFLKAVVLGRRD